MNDEPSDGSLDPNTFVVPEFPWMLFPISEDGEDVGDITTVLRLTLREPGAQPRSLLPLFTDEDLAERFAADLEEQAGEMEPFRTPHRQWMRELLTLLHADGVTHACFDPGPERRVYGPTLPILKLASYYS